MHPLPQIKLLQLLLALIVVAAAREGWIVAISAVHAVATLAQSEFALSSIKRLLVSAA
jgi:hypothetical protein